MNNFIKRGIKVFSKPLTANLGFVVYMFLLSIFSNYISSEVYRDTHMHSRVWASFFIDIYIICIPICMFTYRTARLTKAFIAFISTFLFIVEWICIANYGSTFNPSMLTLLLETNTREVLEFCQRYLTIESICKVLLFILLFFFVLKSSQNIYKKKEKLNFYKNDKLTYLFFFYLICVFTYSGKFYVAQKNVQGRLLASSSISEMENIILSNVPSHDYNDIMGQPFYRLLYSIDNYYLMSKQIKSLRNQYNEIKIVQNKNKELKVILIIGESYNKHHSQLYGYSIETTPNQFLWNKEKNLYKFTDAVSTWDLTSFAIKNLMTTYCINGSEEWSDYPLISAIMRRAGYYTSFITNQFVPNKDNSICGISGGFFLNDKILSKQQFDYRNNREYEYDDELINSYLNNQRKKHSKEFTIFHLKGQHFLYSQRFPKEWNKFSPKDVNREDLSKSDQQILADYDNSILYNDHVLNLIVNHYKNDNAVIIYTSDHSERIFGPGKSKKYGRQTFEPIDINNAIENFEIPLWIYFTNKFIEKNPDILTDIKNSLHRPFMSDALPHLIMHLSKVKDKTFKDEFNIFSSEYNVKRERLLRKEVDYNSLTK